jgi:hypothetical protein
MPRSWKQVRKEMRMNEKDLMQERKVKYILHA